MVDDQHVNLTRLGGVFNWTMTYRLDSDVVVPYGRVTPKSSVNSTLTSDYVSAFLFSVFHEYIYDIDAISI